MRKPIKRQASVLLIPASSRGQRFQLRTVKSHTYAHDNLDGDTTLIYRATLPAGIQARRSDLLAELDAHFFAGCSCAHDCCGHWFGGLREVRWLGKRQLSIRLHYARNV
jgi:hypothetical protein